MVQGYASREAVLDILLEQEATGAFLKDLFPRYADRLPIVDRALAREMALGVIRNRSLLDYNIDARVDRKPGPGALRMVLRLGAYQLWFMEVPDFAAVNTSVELAKHRVDRGKAGFVNALLKRMAESGPRRVPGRTAKALSTNYSHPLWLVERWQKRLGDQGVEAALARNNQEAPLWVRVNPRRSSPEAAREQLAALGVLAEPDSHAETYLRLAEGGGAGGKALRSDLFASGGIAFQDPAAWLVAELADWKPGQSLLDLCAAPGGKAAAMVERAIRLGATPGGPSSRPERLAAVCNDLSFRRLRRIRDAQERLGHGDLMPLVMDPARNALKRRFDVVVVDAPCSNLGVIRRRPEARWSHALADLGRLAKLQGALLDQAAELSAPDGRVIYATCSPEPEESVQVVEAFLKRHSGWALEDASALLPRWAVESGCLWLHPGETEYDGFFGARLVRRAAR